MSIKQTCLSHISNAHKNSTGYLPRNRTNQEIQVFLMASVRRHGISDGCTTTVNLMVWIPPQGQTIPPESRISYRHGLIFESLRQPRLEGELKNAESDLDLHGKYVQVVGYVQQQELGNCFLSFHIVEPAVHPADGFDR